MSKELIKYLNKLKFINSNQRTRFDYSSATVDKLMEEQHYVMGRVSINEFKINRVNALDFMLAIYKEHVIDDLSHGVVETGLKEANGMNINNSNDVLSMLITDGASRGFRTIQRDYIYSLIHEVDNIFGLRYFFMNTNDLRFPLTSMRISNFLLLYRYPNEEYLYTNLLQLCKYLMPKAISEYIIYTSSRKTVEYKKYLLSMFLGVDLYEVSNDSRFNDVINDAYVNLINMSNIGLERPVEDIKDDLINIKDEMKQNIMMWFNNGGYKPVHTVFENSLYEQLMRNLSADMNKMINYIKHPRGIPPFDVKHYYIYDQKIKEANRFKIEYEFMKKEIIKYYRYNKKVSGIISSVHPDIIVGLFNLKLHIEMTNLNIYYHNSPLVSLINYILSPTLRLKPVLIKYVLKNAEDPYYHVLKQQGCILFNQLECLFGFRNSHVILEEVKDDYKNWVAGDQDKYSYVQSQHIKNSFKDFTLFQNVEGKYLGEIFKRNAIKYRSYDDVVGDPSVYLAASGAVDKDNFVAETIDGKSRTVSKSDFFSLFFEPDQGKQDYRWSCKNKVIIKYEEYIKQRIVINTTMRTYYPLARLSAFITKMTNGSGVMHFSNTKAQKGNLYARMQKYLLYNKYKSRRYVLMPLDYSSYDHTITLDCICEAIAQLGDFCGFGQAVRHDINLFRHYLKQEVIYFKELGNDPINNSKYKYGVLSGWKITSSGESLLNAITTVGIIKSLNYNLVDFITMGDDLVIVVDNGGVEPDLQQVLEDTCNAYQGLGYKMNVPKNSVGYYFLEFLRVVYYPGVVRGYPIRMLPSLSVMKPGREEATFGVVELDTTLRHILKRYGIGSQYFKLANYITKEYKKRDIRKMFFDYVKTPYKYNIIREKRLDYKFKVDINKTPIYRKYLSILGLEYKNIISKYLDKEFLERGVVVSTLKKEHKQQKLKELYKSVDSNFVYNTFHEFLNSRVIREGDLSNKLKIPDYHLSKLCLRIIDNMSFDKAIIFVNSVSERLANRRLISKQDHAVNTILLSSLHDKSSLRGVFSDDKVSVVEGNIPSAVLSQIKINFIKFINFKVNASVGKLERAKYRLLINKNRNYYLRYLLGTLLNDCGEIKIPDYGILIASQYD